MHRFFISPDQVIGSIVHFDADQSRQISRVLRLRPGDRVVVLDGAGLEFEVALDSTIQSRATGSIADRRPAGGEPVVRLTLYQSLLKREKFEWVLQKGTEIGVARFVPVITSRSLIRDPVDSKPEKLNRWRRIIREAAEQSGRGRLPQLLTTEPFSNAAAGASCHDCAIIAWEGAVGETVRSVLKQNDTALDVGLFIGPEGGFEPNEIDEAMSHHIFPVTLGPRILRTETAAVVATALILHELGETG
jgi:16S rRNA (uracil1498-N3)-methyltransferase